MEEIRNHLAKLVSFCALGGSNGVVVLLSTSFCFLCRFRISSKSLLSSIISRHHKLTVAAYEAMTLFGKAMVDAFDVTSDSMSSRASDAKQVRDAGRLLTATEVSATKRYWHVWNGTDHVNTYPSDYKAYAVGMLYETMASFQTWFSGGDLVSYGIQLLPFTPVAERRDNPEWARLVYPQYKKSCAADEKFCVHDGWKV